MMLNKEYMLACNSTFKLVYQLLVDSVMIDAKFDIEDYDSIFHNYDRRRLKQLDDGTDSKPNKTGGKSKKNNNSS
jgi:hypothetical protein